MINHKLLLKLHLLLFLAAFCFALSVQAGSASSGRKRDKSVPTSADQAHRDPGDDDSDSRDPGDDDSDSHDPGDGQGDGPSNDQLAEDIATNADSIATNTDDIRTNADDIEANAAAIEAEEEARIAADTQHSEDIATSADNIEANAEVQVQISGDSFDAKARILSDEEKQEVWGRIREAIPQLDIYQKRTDRNIRVFRLSRS